MLLQLCQLLEDSRYATYVHESAYGFPALVTLHLLGLGSSVGILVWFDLRLIGVVFAGSPASYLYRRLFPWIAAGFSVAFASGVALFVPYATSAYGNGYFRIKLAAIGVAAINAGIYHLWIERPALPGRRRAERLAGAISLLCWATVVLAGRLMSYTMF